MDMPASFLKAGYFEKQEAALNIGLLLRGKTSALFFESSLPNQIKCKYIEDRVISLAAVPNYFLTVTAFVRGRKN